MTTMRRLEQWALALIPIGILAYTLHAQSIENNAVLSTKVEGLTKSVENYVVKMDASVEKLTERVSKNERDIATLGERSSHSRDGS